MDSCTYILLWAYHNSYVKQILSEASLEALQQGRGHEYSHAAAYSFTVWFPEPFCHIITHAQVHSYMRAWEPDYNQYD